MVPSGMFVELIEYPGYYVTDTGEVWSTKQVRRGFVRKSQFLDRNGYLYVGLVTPNGHKNIKAHRLVMGAFEGPSPLQVNHINGNKQDNTLDNLEYCTALENVMHAYSSGLRDAANILWNERRRTFIGEKAAGAKLTDAQAAELIRLKGTISRKQAMEKYNVSEATVKRVWYNKTFKHLPRN